MDKYEYQVCTEQIKSLIAEKRFAEAMDLADTIDWRRVRSVSMLCTVSEIYKINKRYEDARDILLLAYERHPTGRDIIYALCELAIKTNDIVQAIECYKEFVAIAPNDPDSYVLLYKIYKAQDVSLEEQIDILEELKSKDYREKWGYELAYLYHLTGQETKCIAACDELVLWFGDGKYVKKSLELKKQHTTLTPEQQAKYEGRSTGSIPSFNQPYEQSQFGNNPQMTGPMMSQYGEYIQQTGAITGQLPSNDYYNTGAMAMPPVQEQFTGQIAGENNAIYTGQMPVMDSQMNQTGQMGPVMDQYGNLVQTTGQYGDFVPVNPAQYNSYGQPIQPAMNHLGMTQDIILNPSESSFSTMDLQEALGNQVKEVMALNVDGTQPIVYDNNEAMYKDVQRDNTSPALFEEKYADESDEQGVPTVSTGTAMVHTGVIDLSDADLPPVDNSPIEISDTTPVKEDVIVSVEKKSIEETTDIISKLQGVIPGSVPVSKESTEVERIPGTTAAAGTGTIKGISAIRDLPDDMPLTGANGSVINAPKTKSRVTGSIPEFLPSMKDVEPDKADEENSADTNNEDISEEVREEVREEVKETAAEPINSDINNTSEAESEAESKTDEESDAVEVKEEEQEKTERPAPQYPYDTVTDIGYVEELPELNQSDDVEDMYGTKDIPVEEIEEEAKKAYETDILPEADEFDNFEDDPDTDGNIYTRMKRDVKANRDFDDDEFRIFCKYDGIESLKAQLVDAMDLMSMDGNHGNVVVMGSDNVDRKDIAISIVKVLKEKSQIFSGKVAKISGEALNKKNIKSTLSKLENGALIVESAGGLTSESMILITGALKDDNPSVLVVLEDTKENIKPLYKATKQMRTVFDSRVDIEDFTNNDLVAYGRGYALEKEYTIDEFGTLALSSKLGELQTYDHRVTTGEVKEIIDMAIKHADKKNVGNFMDVLLGKKYDDDDFIILKEKDFNF